MNAPTHSAPDRHAQARALAERKAWAELLEFARGWQREVADAPKAFFFQGVALVGMGRFLEATTAYQRCLELDAKDFKAWNNLAQVLFESMGRVNDAFFCMEKMVALDPQNKLAWSNLASMHGQLGRVQEALACAERALAIDPTMVEAQLHRARAAQLLGRTDLLREASSALAQVPADHFRRSQ